MGAGLNPTDLSGFCPPCEAVQHLFHAFKKVRRRGNPFIAIALELLEVVFGGKPGESLVARVTELYWSVQPQLHLVNPTSTNQVKYSYIYVYCNNVQDYIIPVQTRDVMYRNTNM